VTSTDSSRPSAPTRHLTCRRRFCAARATDHPIGRFAIKNPPATPIDVPSGLQYALEPYRGGFLVTDGHHNRVYRVKLDGEVTEPIAFGNIGPAGLAVRGTTIYMAEVGPVPHLPENGRLCRSARSPARRLAGCLCSAIYGGARQKALAEN
jgi:hypothetical protein